jgi:glucokinase
MFEPTLGGVELVAGAVRVASVSTSGRIIRRAEEAMPIDAPAEELSSILLSTVRRCLLGAQDLDDHQGTGVDNHGGQALRGVGVASDGLVDPRTGVLRRIDDRPELTGFPISTTLQRELGAPVFADHRARVQVLGDRWFGQGAGRSCFASVATGETVGIGILHEGNVIAPLGGRSGAHITVAVGGRRCSCGNFGCWKTIATSGWLREAAVADGLGPISSVADLLAAARTQPAARRLIDQYADNIAVGLGSVQHLLAPGLYIVHGEAADAGGGFLRRIEDRLRAISDWAEFAERPRVIAADTSADDVALLGAAGLVLSRLSG